MENIIKVLVNQISWGVRGGDNDTTNSYVHLIYNGGGGALSDQIASANLAFLWFTALFQPWITIAVYCICRVV